MRNFSTSKVYPNRTNDPLTADGMTVTAYPVPSDYHEIIGAVRGERENIVVHPDLITRSELVRRQNFRLVNPDNGVWAQFSLPFKDTSVGDPTNIWVGPNGWSRLGLSQSDAPVNLDFDMRSTRTDLTNQEAKNQGECVEVLEDDGTQTDLMIFAYNGGDIERHTYDQAKAMYDRIIANGGNASLYAWRGYTTGADPVAGFYKWHITSVDIHPESHELLNSIKNRRFDYTISFHGFSRTDEVAIGGNASNDFKSSIQNVYDNIVDSSISTGFADPQGIYGGNEPENLLNRLAGTESTIQIEQSFSVRNNYWEQVSKDMADHYLNNVLV